MKINKLNFMLMTLCLAGIMTSLKLESITLFIAGNILLALNAYFSFENEEAKQ